MGCICGKLLPPAAPQDFAELQHASNTNEEVYVIGPDAPDPARLWIPDLVWRYAACLPPNEIPCTLRLVNKATAAQFSSPRHTSIQPILPVPPHYFRRCWGAPAIAAAATLAVGAVPTPEPQQQHLAQAPLGSTVVASDAEAVKAGHASSQGGAAATDAATTAGQKATGAAAGLAAASTPPAEADAGVPGMVAIEEPAGPEPSTARHGNIAPIPTSLPAQAAVAADARGDDAGADDGASSSASAAVAAAAGAPAAPPPQAASAAAALPAPAPAPLPLPPGAYRGSCGGDLLWLSGRQRVLLLSATAASGVVENLEVGVVAGGGGCSCSCGCSCGCGCVEYGQVCQRRVLAGVGGNAASSLGKRCMGKGGLWSSRGNGGSLPAFVPVPCRAVPAGAPGPPPVRLLPPHHRQPPHVRRRRRPTRHCGAAAAARPPLEPLRAAGGGADRRPGARQVRGTAAGCRRGWLTSSAPGCEGGAGQGDG